MIPDKLLEVITRLKDKTSRGDVIWNKASGPTEFQLLLKIGSITISRWGDDESNEEYIDFIIYNDRGEIIDKLFFDNRESKLEFNELEELHNVIRRKYLKADEVLENLLHELRIGGKIGKEIENEPKGDDLPF